jgi:hypothetical protein
MTFTSALPDSNRIRIKLNGQKAAKKAAKTIDARQAAPQKVPVPKKRTLSAAGMKRISDAAKKRWAAKRKGDAAK